MNPDFLDQLLGSNLLSDEQIRGFEFDIDCENFLAQEINQGRPVEPMEQRASKRLHNV